MYGSAHWAASGSPGYIRATMAIDGPGPDLIIIGAGVIGAAIALELQRSGRQVLVLDKGEAVGGGSTSASSSIVRFTYSTLEGVAVAWEARHRWLDWAGHLGPFDGPLAEFHQIGMLDILAPETDRRAMLEHFDRFGIAYQLLEGPELARRFPALDTGRFWPPRLPDDPAFFDEPDGQVAGLLMPQSGFVDDPQLAAVNLMDAARAGGATVALRREVVGIVRSGGGNRVAGVELAGGERIGAPVVVNAAGPWSAQLNRLAGVDDDLVITTRALRQDVASTSAPMSFGVGTGGVVLGDLDLGCYSRPQPGGSYLIGGIEAECDPLVWLDDADDFSPNPDPTMWEALVLRVARRIPELAVPRRPQGLAAAYDVTEDWIPIYDRSSLDGFYLAIGTSGNQFKNAPLAGEIMRDLIDAVESGHDHDADPVRFECRVSGVTVDLGHYSRLREPTSTSGTVMG